MIDYKLLTKEDLQYIFKDVHFKIPLMLHQLVSLAFAAERQRTMFFHDVGTGKTAIALCTVNLWGNKKILVVCPSSAFGAWERDILKFTDFSFVFLVGSARERRSLLKKKKDIYIINYEGLKTIYGHLIAGKGWKINFDSFKDKFDCIIFDEVHKCRNYKSLQSEICYELSRRAGCSVGLTGTPIDRSMLELFNVYRVVDLGKSLGTNFFRYRKDYFSPGRYEWYLKPGCDKKILERLSNSTLSFDRKECFDLPEIQEVVKIIRSYDEFLKLQRNIIQGKAIKIPSGIVDGISENTTVAIKIKGDKLRQLSSGFIYYDIGESRKSYLLKKNPKIEALVDILEDSRDKAIIFYHYIEEGVLIEEAIRKMNISFVEINGNTGGKEKSENAKRFMEDDSVRILLCQSSSSEGFDAYVANIVIFFSPVASPMIRKQCIGRMYRKGKQEKSLVIDLILEQSIDAKILENRGKRISLIKTVMDYIQSYKQNF